jgi:hypothetical protein
VNGGIDVGGLLLVVGLTVFWLRVWRRTSPRPPRARLGQLALWALLSLGILIAYGFINAFIRIWSLSE